jgi:hypothetical protein
MKFTKITKEEMDEKLRADKGWIVNTSGNEFVYDFHLAKIPVILKVASSIRCDDGRSRNKGADAIRVYAVVKDSMDRKNYKVVRGLLKSRRVYRVEGWRNNLQRAVLETLVKAKTVYRK